MGARASPLAGNQARTCRYGKAAGRSGTFVPHLTPLIRGIHATLYARIEKETDFQSLFEQHYANEPFVDVLPAKSHPETRSVRSANVCRIAVHRHRRRYSRRPLGYRQSR